MAIIYKLDQYRPKSERLIKTVVSSNVIRPRPMPENKPSGFVDNVVLTIWTIFMTIGWIIRFPLGCWVIIEWIRSAFGHPGWHVLAYLALLVAIHLVPVFYTPKSLK